MTEIIKSREERNKEIIDYVTTINDNGVRQHSKEWLLEKQFTVGGSELATIIGKNPYESQAKKVMLKIGLDRFPGDQKVSWGNVFEDIVKEFTEETFDTEVHGDNIFIKVSEGPLAGKVSYSPDGLCVVSNDILIERYGRRHSEFNSLTPGQYSTILLEFKAPYSRTVDKYSIPQYYEPQPTMGLDIIKFCDLALFIEAVFRICYFDTLESARIHKNYPATHPESSEIGKVYSYGTIIIYGPNDDTIVESINEVYGALSASNDLAELNNKLLDALFIGMSNGKYKYVRSGPCDSVSSVKKIRKRKIRKLEVPEGYSLYGSLFWKLMDYKVKPVFPVENYLESHANEINKFLEVCDNARKLSNRGEVAEYVCDTFCVDLSEIY